MVHFQAWRVNSDLLIERFQPQEAPWGLRAALEELFQVLASVPLDSVVSAQVELGHSAEVQALVDLEALVDFQEMEVLVYHLLAPCQVSGVAQAV